MKIRKIRIVQAKLHGRAERLTGGKIENNPHPHGSELWYAFNNGFFRDVNDPLFDELRRVVERDMEYRGELAVQVATRSES